MENLNISNHTLIDSLYRKHSKKILNYIAVRVNDRAMVENLAQDVWFKALTCGKPINEETALPFIYKSRQSGEGLPAQFVCAPGSCRS